MVEKVHKKVQRRDRMMFSSRRSLPRCVAAQDVDMDVSGDIGVISIERLWTRMAEQLGAASIVLQNPKARVIARSRF
jgi:hypothetical protein